MLLTGQVFIPHHTPMKQYPNGMFCWPGCSPCRHFTGCTKKKQQTNWEWKEETDKHGFRTAKLRRWSLALLSILVCIYVHGQHENSASPIQLPTHLAIVFTSVLTPCSRVSLPTSEMSDPPFRTDCFRFSLTTSLHFSLPVSQVFMSRALCVVFMPK